MKITRKKSFEVSKTITLQPELYNFMYLPKSKTIHDKELANLIQMLYIGLPLPKDLEGVANTIIHWLYGLNATDGMIKYAVKMLPEKIQSESDLKQPIHYKMLNIIKINNMSIEDLAQVVELSRGKKRPEWIPVEFYEKER